MSRDQPDAVGVVAKDAVVVEAQRVDRAGGGARAASGAAVGEGLELERQRHVQPPAAGGAEGLDRGDEAVQRRGMPLVDDVLRRSARANCAWIAGERLCATGLPTTA